MSYTPAYTPAEVAALKAKTAAKYAKTAAVKVVAARPAFRPNGLGRRTGCACGSQEGGMKDTDCRECKHNAPDGDGSF
jgi:hypothetical protein